MIKAQHFERFVMFAATFQIGQMIREPHLTNRNALTKLAIYPLLHFDAVSTCGNRVTVSSLPKYIQWIPLISYVRLEYKILLSLLLTDATVDGSFLGLGLIPANFLLEHQLEVPEHSYPGPIFSLLIHFLVYALGALVFLHLVPPSHYNRQSVYSPLDQMLRGFFGILINLESLEHWLSSKLARHETKTKNVLVSEELAKGKETADSSTRVDEISVKTLDESTNRVDIYCQQLNPCDPVKIQVRNLTLTYDIKSNVPPLGEQNQSTRLQRFKSIFRDSKHIQKTILQDINLDIHPGELTVIMGGSGSGKTSLLDAIQRQSPANIKITGSIHFKDPRDSSLFKINPVCGYVRQHDGTLMTHLTVRETLRYSADLSLGLTVSRQDRWARVEEVIDLIGLRDCAEVLVGGGGFTGCSGGQRKRLSIGIQLISEPDCLFLDEPTTGLDSLTALSIARLLKMIAKSGRTVVCSIHQPQQDIWDEFDNVALLVYGGQLVYSGKAQDAIQFLEMEGYPMLPWKSTPDFLIDITTAYRQNMDPDAVRLANSQRLTVANPDQEEDTTDPIIDNDNEPQEKTPKKNTRPRPGFLWAMIVLTRLFPLYVNAVSVLSLFIINFCHISAGESMAIIFLSLFPAIGPSLLVSVSIIMLAGVGSGIAAIDVPKVLTYLNYINHYKYASTALVATQVAGHEIHCTTDLQGVFCLFTNTDQILNIIGYKDEGVLGNILATVGLIIFYRLVGWLVLEMK
ncbi:hypothetical protein BGW38_003015, partial [Lunasporangiospora selenospora]